MKLSDFDYPLPPELIAQTPLEDRAASRMLVVDRGSGTWADRRFRDLPSYLCAGDCLVLNDTRVFPARLLGTIEGSARRAEIFLVRALDQQRERWLALAKPGRHLRNGARVRVGGRLTAEVLAVHERGEREVILRSDVPVMEAIEGAGHVPLPPYIHRSDSQADRSRYQTVFASQAGSVAAPTAGLHFTDEVLSQCRAAGAAIAKVTLHVGLGTFQPLQSETVEENRLHSEWYSVSHEAAAQIAAAKRVVAVGTTSTRTLESIVYTRGRLEAASGETGIFIYPGHSFGAVGALLTNFHLPKSSLMLLVSAFAGRELILAAYHHAVRERYRFFSYGDCMLIL